MLAAVSTQALSAPIFIENFWCTKMKLEDGLSAIEAHGCYLLVRIPPMLIYSLIIAAAGSRNSVSSKTFVWHRWPAVIFIPGILCITIKIIIHIISEGVKRVNQWRIGPGSPFKAQAFVQPESNIARLNSGRWRRKNQTYICTSRVNS